VEQVQGHHQGYLREKKVIELLDISRSTLWAWIRAGRFPRGVKIGPRATAWSIAAVDRHLKALEAAQSEPAIAK